MNPGFYENLSSEEYHGSLGISRSSIMRYKESPFKYFHAKHKEATKTMMLGSAFHALVLEPALFSREYIVAPAKLKLKDVGRIIYDENQKKLAELEGKEKVITLEDYELLKNMLNALIENKETNALIYSKGYRESSIYWTEEGMLVKARPDLWCDDVIIDLKTCDSASTRDFQNAMAKGGYHIQGAMIQDGLKAILGKEVKTVINICVETKWPHEVGIKIISEDALKTGRKEYKEILKKIKVSAIDQKWPSYESEIVHLPAWYKD